MTLTDIAALGKRAEDMIEALAKISAAPDRLVRLFLTPEHRRAADLVAEWMRDAGLEVSEDALGTVRGRWPARVDGARRLLIGSHIDTVVDAGKYDGPLGVIAGILAVSHLKEAKRELPFGIDVLAFGDEESSRFPRSMSGSAAAAGVFDRAYLTLVDRDGVSFADALKAYGKRTEDIDRAAYDRHEAAAYVEVHIEQGPVLDAEGEPLGVVEAIIGRTQLRVTVRGEAGHAGTVPMRLRRDALAAAAELILAAEDIACRHADDRMVITVGEITVLPGGINIIPARATFTVDIRSMTDALRREAVASLRAEAWRIVEARSVEIAIDPIHDSETVPCDPRLKEVLAASIAALGHRPVRLPSGAGHDAQVMATLCPAAMLFVRCRGGVSHNPAEYASPADMGLAIAALIGFIERFEKLS